MGYEKTASSEPQETCKKNGVVVALAVISLLAPLF
jgi:hypothetical protein